MAPRQITVNASGGAPFHAAAMRLVDGVESICVTVGNAEDSRDE